MASNISLKASKTLVAAGTCLALWMAATGSGQAQKPGDGERGPAAAEKSFVPASIKVLPGLQCSIYPEGSDPSTGLEVFADDDGYARFHAVRAEGGNAIKRLTLGCKDANGKPSSFAVDLTSDATFEPRPLDLSKERGTDRPALTGDPLRFTQAQLIEAGYGLRPDPQKDPDAYNRWLSAASKPGRMLQAKRPASHEHTVITTTGGPWVGSVLGGSPSYIAIEAYFNVPKAIHGGDKTTGTEISIWDGLGGFGTGPGLIQAGVSLQTTSAVATYGSWREYCCGHGLNGNSNGYGGAFKPNPGDDIYDVNWYCDAKGNPNINGGYGCSFLQDLTTGAILSCTRPQGTPGSTPCWSANAHPLCSAVPAPPKAAQCMTLGVNAEFVIENQAGQCCAPATAFTDFRPKVTMTGSAYSTKTGSYSQTINSDSQVFLLKDFTDTTTHIDVWLGKAWQTNFRIEPHVPTAEVKGDIKVAGAQAKGFADLKCDEIAIEASSKDETPPLGVPKWERHANATGSWASGSCSYQVNVPANSEFQVRLLAAVKSVPCGGYDTVTSTPAETDWLSVNVGGVKTEDFKLDSVGCVALK
ncbi:MAG TPA: G1 family glutamic endopeptidase [Candidatus Angelobacter sp.]|nr:G1 family glutamic endopeptidase [Candidatus Angelobacter sp.]